MKRKRKPLSQLAVTNEAPVTAKKQRSNVTSTQVNPRVSSLSDVNVTVFLEAGRDDQSNDIEKFHVSLAARRRPERQHRRHHRTERERQKRHSDGAGRGAGGQGESH